MGKHLTYTSYLARHKLFVGQEMFKRGLWWRGIWHDLDKFTPSRWMAYANYFSAGDPTPEAKNAFGASWRSHAYRNDHHWQHWVSISDNGKIVAHEMSEVARKEMLCDWIGAHKAVKGNSLLAWYTTREATILIAPKTKKWIKQELLKLEGVL